MKYLEKVFSQKRKSRQEWSLIQSLLWAQVSQLTFTYLLRLAITPYSPYLALVLLMCCIVIVYCI